MSKVIGIFVQFTKPLTKYGLSRDSDFKFRKIYFSPNSILNFTKRYQIWGKLAQEEKSHRQKPIGGGKHPAPVLIGLNLSLGASLVIFTGSSPNEQIISINYLRINIQEMSPNDILHSLNSQAVSNPNQLKTSSDFSECTLFHI